MKQGRTPCTLLVEDNVGDVRLMLEAMREAGIDGDVHVAPDGEDAMAYLRRLGPYADSPRPALILLDLNLPRKSGREVLAEIKGDATLKQIPVVVLTTSRDADDVERSYDLNVNSYVTKPVDLDQLIMVVDAIKRFWLDTATPPIER